LLNSYNRKLSVRERANFTTLIGCGTVCEWRHSCPRHEMLIARVINIWLLTEPLPLVEKITIIVKTCGTDSSSSEFKL